ncbi:MAG: hypothetical protein EHM45_05475 [Desulfobacteraceae bacterium]|nr:MAG: hypothetical protein EHM45_05475 [Desulfobacteraceae bacterium]
MGKLFIVKKAGIDFNCFNKLLCMRKLLFLLCILANPYLSIVSADMDSKVAIPKTWLWIAIDTRDELIRKPIPWAQSSTQAHAVLKRTNAPATLIASVSGKLPKKKNQTRIMDAAKIPVEDYKIQKGDQLWRLLKKRGLLKTEHLPTLIATLKRLNPALANLDLIRPGAIIRIPQNVNSVAPNQGLPSDSRPIPKEAPIYPGGKSRPISSTQSIFFAAPLPVDQDRVADNQGLPIAAAASLLDTDQDALTDDLEAAGCTHSRDADTDADGIPDGMEDQNHNGRVDADETDPCNCDTDGDGIQDGTETGLTLQDVVPDTDLAIFQPDLDPATHTHPLDADSDDDGLNDGQEDGNHNGKVDKGEKDPNVKILEFNILSGKLTNPYAPYQAGKKYIYSGTGAFKGFSRYQYAETIEPIDGVNCLRITIRGSGNDPDPETDPEYYQIWLAEDIAGVVWLLQVYAGYEDKTTFFGIKDAVLWMPHHPVKGQEFRQTANEFSSVKAVGANGPLLSIGLRFYANCLVVQRSAAGGRDLDILYLAPGSALIKEDWNDNNQINGWDLSTIEHPAFMSALIVDFGTQGLYHYDGSRWTRLAQTNVEHVFFYNHTLVADAGCEHGLQEYADQTWKQISQWDADNTGNPLVAFRNTLVVDFGARGLYAYNGTAWSKFTDRDVECLGIYQDKLVADTGAPYGLWEYDGKEWRQISPLDADNTGNTFVAYRDGVVVDFGTNGLRYYSGATWIKLADVDAECLAAYGDKLVVDAGSYGLYEYDGKAWKQISPVNPDNTGNAFVAFREGLVVDFGAAGVQFYNGLSWTTLVLTDAEYLCVYDDKLVVDAGDRYGLYEYDGRTWKQISSANADNTGNGIIKADLPH